MAQRNIAVKIDIVQDSQGLSKLKSALKDVQRDVERENQKQEREIIRRNQRLAKLARDLVNDDIKEQRRLARERTRIANEFIASQKRMQASSGVGFGSIVGGSFLGSIGANAFSRITSEATQAGHAVFEFSSKVQQSQVAFTGLMKNATLAQRHIKELKDLSTSTPLEFTSIAKMSQRLQGAGIEAKKVIPLIKDIGNIAAATGDLGAERMEGLATALSQIASKGRVSAEEMEQLAERGVPAWRILSEAIGKTAAETRKMAEDGKITSEQLFQAFQRFSRMNFGDAMAKQANTFSGAMQSIKNVLLVTAQTAFQPFFDKITTLAAETSKKVQAQKGDFAKVGATIGEAMGKAAGIAFLEAMKSAPGAISGAKTAFNSFTEEVGTSIGQSILRGIFQALEDAGISTMSPGRRKRLGIPDVEVRRRTGYGYQTAPGFQVGDYSRPWDFKPKPNNEPSNVRSMLDAMRQATMGQESGGRAGIRNRRTDASGLFQVMPANIGPWTQAALGQRLSQRDFLNSPSAQKAVFDHVMGQYLQTAMILSGGNKDVAIRMAAAAWYGGPGAMRRYNDPTVFRKGEPSFAEYTGSVLRRTKTGESSIGMSDVRDDLTQANKELANKLSSQSDAATQAQRDKIIDQAIHVFKLTGMLPTPELIDEFIRRQNDYERGTGRAQTSKADALNVLNQISAGRSAPLTTTPGDVSVGVTNRVVEPSEDYVRAYENMIEANERLREEQQRLFEETANGWHDLLRDLTSGNFKGVFERFKTAMLDQLLRPLSQFMAGAFGGAPGYSMAGAGGGMLGGIFGGGGMGPGGTPMFNPGGNFVSSGGTGGGGILGSLIGGGGGGIGGMLGGIFGRGGGVGAGGGGILGGLGRIFGMGGGGAIGHEAGHAGSILGGAGGILGAIGSFMPFIGLGLTFAPLIAKLFSRDKSLKQLKAAAASEYGINVKDKDVLKQLRDIGEAYFGKGQAGANANAVVNTDEGQNILRAYASASGQSSEKIDNLYKSDEGWKGNQFRSRFGGFRAMGGPVTAGRSYVVGERGPEMFTPGASGSISPSGDPRMMHIIGTLEETIHQLATKLQTLSAGQIVAWGADENPQAFTKAINVGLSTTLRGGENQLRATGVY